MPMFSNGRLHVIDVSTPEAKQRIARYWGDAVQHFLTTGNTSRLRPYERWTVKGLLFETDPDVIEDWFLSTDFDFQEIYEP